MNLYDVTIRRTYSADYKAKWPGPSSQDTESTFPMWAADEFAVAVRWPYESPMYRDEVASVRQVPPPELAERRARAAQHLERCCEQAVPSPCVCRVAFTCPEHGENHHGTHD